MKLITVEVECKLVTNLPFNIALTNGSTSLAYIITINKLHNSLFIFVR